MNFQRKGLAIKAFAMGFRFLINDAEGFSPKDAWNLLFETLSPGEVRGAELNGTFEVTGEGDCYICILNNVPLKRCRVLYAKMAAHPLIASHLLFYRPVYQSNRLERLVADYEYLGTVADTGEVQYGTAAYGTMRFTGVDKKADPFMEPVLFLIAPDAYRGILTPTQSIRILMRVAYEYFPGAQIVPFQVADGGKGTIDALIHALGGRYVKSTYQEEDGTSFEATYGILPDRTVVIEAQSRRVADRILCETLDSGFTSFIIGLTDKAEASSASPFILPLHPRIGNVNVQFIDSGTGTAYFLDKADFAAAAKTASVVITGDGYKEGEQGAAVGEILSRCEALNIPAVSFMGADKEPATVEEAMEQLRFSAGRLFSVLKTGRRLLRR